MLQFVLGRAGTGKTTWLWRQIRAQAAAGSRCLLLVPEQFASTSDLAGYQWLGDRLHGQLKVCSFRTLTGLLEDRYGGGALHSVSDAGRLVLMRRTLGALGEQLVCFRRSRRSARFCADCAETLQQLKYCGVSPDLLQTAGEEAGGLHGRRLQELALIYRRYEELREATGLETVDRLSRAAERLQPDFFAGTACYVDGFGEFTAPEAALLRRMLAAAPCVTVALPCPDADFSGHRFTVFAPAADTGAHLARLAAELGVATAPPVVLTHDHRFADEKLAQVEGVLAGAAPLKKAPPQESDKAGDLENSKTSKPALAEGSDLSGSSASADPSNFPAGTPTLADGCLVCYAADGRYEEARFVAARIAALARRGVPYQQTAIVCRDPAQYLPALTYACKLYDIPLFTGSTVSAQYAPMAVFLRAALGLAKSLNSDDLLALLKTGLCGASEAAISALENYVYTWRPHAADWRAPFTNSPAGMDARAMDPEAAAALLEAAEGLRARLMGPVETFLATRGKTARQLSAALYQLLLDLGADEVVREWIAAEATQGLGSFDSARMWETVIGFLDEMTDLLGDEEITAAEYDDLLCVLLRAAEIGQAPHTQNQVQLAAADSARLDNPAHVFVMGLNEGVFPAPVGDNPLLTNQDRSRLSRLGAPLSGDYESMVLREEMHLYRALSAAREGLCLSWLDKKDGVPQAVCARVQQLCAALELVPAAPTLAQLAMTPAAALDLLASHYRQDSPEVAALRQVLAARPETAGRLQALEAAAGRQPFAVQDTAALRRLLGSAVNISPSRMESYYSCPFGYFLQYTLKVRPRPRAELGIPQSGTLVHWLLETLLRDFPSLQGLADDTLETEVRQRIAAYIAEQLPGQGGQRFAYLLQRIGDNTLRLLRYLRDELAQSGFVPRAFEQPIGGEEGVPSLEVTGSDGQKIRVIGTVDRVDTMTVDGRTWLRVVDYKTGSKAFSLDDVCCGLNTQMLLYLFTLTRNGAARFGDSRPAGVLYLLSDPAPSTDPVKSAYRVDGLVLDDPQVLAGMDRELSGHYLPCKPDSRAAAGKLVDLATLGRISQRLEALLVQMADTLYAGCIPARPLRHNKQLPCDWCDYRPVCRHRDGEEEDEVPAGCWKQLLSDTGKEETP